MRKLLYAGAAIAAVLLSVPGTALAAKKPDPEQIKPSELSVINAILRQGRQKAEKGDWAGATESYQSVVSNPAFPKLSPEMRHFTYYVLAMAEFYDDAYGPAYTHIVAAAEAAPKEMDASSWLLYARLAAKAGKTEDAGTAAVRAITDFPDQLKKIDSWRIFNLASDLEEIKDDRVTYQKYLEALRAAKYVPEDDFSTSEALWFDLFTIYADRGEDAKAMVLADELTEPYTIARRQIDKRYVRFAPKAEDAYAKALDADIADAQAMMAKHPNKIEGVNALVNKLMNNNRLPEALKVMDEALAKAEAAPKDKPAFEDLKDYQAWSMSTRASILQLMGRNEDALAAQTKAREIAVAADENMVSHRVNLGGLLNELGRPADALAEIKDVFDDKTSSDYGVMAAEEVRACAHAQLGDKAGLAKSLEFMRAHAEDGEATLQSALLCANEMDEAAKRLISRLYDPLKRGPVLLTLQTYLPKPRSSAWQTTTSSRLAALLARPDVQAAVAESGSVRSYPVFGP